MEEKPLDSPNQVCHGGRLPVSSCDTKFRMQGLPIRMFSAVGMLFFVLVSLVGCGDSGPQMAPVTGQVLFKGKPLSFGGVMFQSSSGQPSRGVIDSEGKFYLTTVSDGDGAVVGANKVRITCYEGQNPESQKDTSAEVSLGKLLIPRRYTQFSTSNLTVEVKPDQNEPLVFELE